MMKGRCRVETVAKDVKCAMGMQGGTMIEMCRRNRAEAVRHGTRPTSEGESVSLGEGELRSRAGHTRGGIARLHSQPANSLDGFSEGNG
jgi:hypothetical protein